MFAAIKNFFKKQNTIIYVRFRNDKIYFVASPSGLEYEDMALIAVNRQTKNQKITAVGRAVLELPERDPSVVFTPFKPSDLEPENFMLAEKLVLFLLKKATPKSVLVSPRVIMHPDKSYVSEMEADAYRELALSAGAREVYVHVGDVLESENFEALFDKINWKIFFRVL